MHDGDAAGGTLYVVATPIGNMADLTLRAIDVLRSVPLVAAEDTRMTRRLWARHGITTRLQAYHAHSDPARERALLDHLALGQDLALVSDAGTPLISDPGEGLVMAWAGRGGRVEPIPGASAVLAALMACGLPVARWSFEGFLPRRGRQRRERVAAIAVDNRATVLFEAPGRVSGTLDDLVAACGPGRRAALCRELTKRHEEVRRGALAELADQVRAVALRGEVTLVLAGADASPAGTDVDLEEGRRRVDSRVREGLSRSAAAKAVAAETGLPRRDLFDTRDLVEMEDEGAR